MRVAEHAFDYDLNGNRTRDAASVMNADNHGSLVATTSVYGFDPLDRVASVTKTGAGAGSESYTHDANGNVIAQSIGGVATSFTYDRNRLLTAATGAARRPTRTTRSGASSRSRRRASRSSGRCMTGSTTSSSTAS